MILFFPDADTVRLALTSGLVGADVTLAPAAVSADAQGRLYVEPSVAISKATGKALDRLGVKGSKRHASEAVREVGSWVELVPLVKESGTPEVAGGAAVLFELPTADDLPAIVTEMLRLGNDRQGFRWFDGGDAKRVLLRVVGPPYYTLLRALDAPAGGVRAYLERAPRVWVELGWNHPLAAQVKVADGQLALLTPPADWRFLDEAPYRDVYDLAQFPLPAAPVAWEPADTSEPVTVPLRLAAGNAADAAELWVLRDDPVGQLDALVRDADERLTQRLMFAVATAADGATVAVLRTRPSKLPPPALPLENATAFKPYWKLPNLFLPVGRRLHPTLRRDAVRRLLADDPDQVVWLYPDGKTGFTPERVPDAAFRSLEDWVDYVIEAEQAPLAAWIGATRFEFDHFVCTEGGGPRPKPDKPDREPKAKDEADPAPTAKADAGKTKPAAKAKGGAKAAEYVPPPPEVVAPNEWRVRAKELEARFLAADGPLDGPERAELWPQLARAYTGAGDAAADAAVCWLNALWDADAPAALAAAWAKAELPQLDGPATAADLDSRLKAVTPAVADARAVIAIFLAESAGGKAPRWLADRLPAVQKYLDTHQDTLPVRAVWLAAVRLARLAGGDALGLARARDRLLQRLLTEGLKAERDLPGFLRYAGLRDAERLRAVREKALDLHTAARAWVAHHPPTVPYVDLLFAFALARLGEAAAAKELLEAARRVLDKPVPANWQENKSFDAVVGAIASGFLYAAFGYRIDAALAGRPHAGSLSPALLDEAAAFAQKAKQPVTRGPTGNTDNPFQRADYVVSKMREISRVVDPEEARESYSVYNQVYSEAFRKELLALALMRDPAKLAEKVRKLAREGYPGKPTAEVQLFLLHEALPLAGRVGETLAVELLRQVPAVLTGIAAKPPGPADPTDVVKRQGELVERAVFCAAHFGRSDLLQPVVAGFAAVLRSRPEEARFKLINIVAGSFLRGLKRLGLRDEIDRFITRLQAEVLQGATPADLRKRYAAKPDTWAAALQTLLNLAAGWLTFGMTTQAIPILNEARDELLGDGRSKFTPKPLMETLRAYVAALGHGPAELGLTRINELLTRFNPKEVANQWTGNLAFSQFHLIVIEEVIWAVVSDEFALGPTGRKWLDDDEFLVRKRVHADMRAERDRAGV